MNIYFKLLIPSIMCLSLIAGCAHDDSYYSSQSTYPPSPPPQTNNGVYSALGELTKSMDDHREERRRRKELEQERNKVHQLRSEMRR